MRSAKKSEKRGREFNVGFSEDRRHLIKEPINNSGPNPGLCLTIANVNHGKLSVLLSIIKHQVKQFGKSTKKKLKGQIPLYQLTI